MESRRETGDELGPRGAARTLDRPADERQTRREPPSGDRSTPRTRRTSFWSCDAAVYRNGDVLFTVAEAMKLVD